jgi:hypothetical protein
MENYLEAIWVLALGNKPVRVKDLSRFLKVKTSSVANPMPCPVEVCTLLDCPHRRLLRQVLTETIEVLEETKKERSNQRGWRG